MHRPIVWESCALLLENFFVIVINHIGGPLSDALLDREKQKRSSDKKHTVNNFNIQWKLCSAKQDLHTICLCSSGLRVSSCVIPKFFVLMLTA